MRAAVQRSLALVTVLAVALGVSVLHSPAALAASTCTTTTQQPNPPTTQGYTVQVCLTAPAGTLTGDTTISATHTVLQGSATVSFLTFILDGDYLLSAFQTPYTFTWHTARHWIDGPHTLGVYAHMSDGTDTRNSPAPGGPATQNVTLANGVSLTPRNTSGPEPPVTGTVPAAGQPEIVGAVGSGADGAGSARVANEVAAWSPNLFLYLGDVYQHGTYEEFDNWYDPSWGKMRGVTNPVPGDQESYYNRGGYSWYWNNKPAYYSYDAAGWHFISLTSCEFSDVPYPPSGLCGTSGAEVTWLNNDLAAHAGACTLAYWHSPLYALWYGPSGAPPGVSDPDEQALWTPLANSHATAVINSDRHNYERWTAMDANGNASPTGMPEFVVGTGGHNFDPLVGSDARVVKTITDTTGALKLSLTTTTAGFQFIAVDGTVGDSGNIPCQGNGTLAGTVTDAASGTPIAGATVSYNGTGPDGHPVASSTPTDGTGHYSVSGLAVTSYTVTAQASGYQGSQAATATVGGRSTTTQNFALTSQSTTLSGSVTDASTGKAIAGASVSAGSSSATTNGNGVYSIAGLTPGTYTATATATGYASQSASVTMTAGANTTQNFSLTPNPGSITGTVTDAGSGAPIVGATVSYSGGSVPTDSTGTYTLSNVAEGTYMVTASASGYSALSQTVGVLPGASATQNFALSTSPGTITGTVTDAATGKAINGATVSYSGGSTITNGSGQYTLTNVAAGSYSVSATASGYASQSQPVTVAGGATATQNFALSPNPGSITGIVSNAGSGAPIAAATVSYSGGSVATDGNGNYTLSNVAEGTYVVTATASGYTSLTHTVNVGPGAAVTQNFALTPPTGAISGTVTAAATGSPISGATVSYSGGSATTNGSGQYTLANVTPGTYTVSASASGYTSQSRSVTVASGATASANFGLWRTPFLSDGFESGTMANWTSSTGLAIETATVHSGSYAAEGSTLNGSTYALKQLNSTYQDLYYRTYFDIKSLSTGFTLMADQTASSGGIIRIYVNPQRQLVLWNDITQLTTTGPTVSLGSWHSVELHVVINGTFGTTEVWLDGAPVPDFSSQSALLGLSPVGQIQIGSQAMLQIYDVALDDVAVSTSRIGP